MSEEHLILGNESAFEASAAMRAEPDAAAVMHDLFASRPNDDADNDHFGDVELEAQADPELGSLDAHEIDARPDPMIESLVDDNSFEDALDGSDSINFASDETAPPEHGSDTPPGDDDAITAEGDTDGFSGEFVQSLNDNPTQEEPGASADPLLDDAANDPHPAEELSRREQTTGATDAQRLQGGGGPAQVTTGAALAFLLGKSFAGVGKVMALPATAINRAIIPGQLAKCRNEFDSSLSHLAAISDKALSGDLKGLSTLSVEDREAAVKQYYGDLNSPLNIEFESAARRLEGAATKLAKVASNGNEGEKREIETSAQKIAEFNEKYADLLKAMKKPGHTDSMFERFQNLGSALMDCFKQLMQAIGSMLRGGQASGPRAG